MMPRQMRLLRRSTVPVGKAGSFSFRMRTAIVATSGASTAKARVTPETGAAHWFCSGPPPLLIQRISVKASEAAELYRRAGRVPPPEIPGLCAEKVVNTRRKAVDGIMFRSTLEARCYQLLRLWEQAGEIAGLQMQPLFVLQPAMR